MDPDPETCRYCKEQTRSYNIVETPIETLVSCTKPDCLKQLDQDLDNYRADEASAAIEAAEREYECRMDAEYEAEQDRKLHIARDGG